MSLATVELRLIEWSTWWRGVARNKGVEHRVCVCACVHVCAGSGQRVESCGGGKG